VSFLDHYCYRFLAVRGVGTSTDPASTKDNMNPRTLARLAAVTAVTATLLLATPATAAPARGGCATDPSWPGATCPITPVIPWEDQGWHATDAVTKAIYVGRHPFANPYILFITWANWRKHSAYGHGYVQDNGQFRTGILLWRVRHHRGDAYYSRMRWTLRFDGAKITIRYALRNGYWHQTYPA